VPTAALEHWRLAKERGVNMQAEWMRRFAEYAKAFPSEAKELGRRWHGDLPAGWEKTLPEFTSENGNVASRAASGTVINAIGPALPELIGGSADLTGSNLTNVKNAGIFSATQRSGRNFHFGIREHAMGAVMNGMALHGGIIPYGGTFLVFADYMRPPIRLAAIADLKVIFVFTHDSIAVGEDGPTHQPVEQIFSLRAIPNLVTIRPADGNETAAAWRIAMERRDGPTALILTRQALPTLDGPADVARGAYIVADGDDCILIGTGSEVSVAVAARDILAERGIGARVVSMPSWELFDEQTPEYVESVLPESMPRVAIEAAATVGWERWADAILGIDAFGASAPGPELMERFGLTPTALADAVTGFLEP
jgi:transketolase